MNTIIIHLLVGICEGSNELLAQGLILEHLYYIYIHAYYIRIYII